MRCLDFEQRMQLLLDHRCRPDYDGQLRMHAAVCDGCQRKLEGQRLLFAHIETSSTAELPGGMATAVLSGLTEQRHVSRQRRQRYLACTLAVCLTGVLFMRHEFRPIDERPRIPAAPLVTTLPALALPVTQQQLHYSAETPRTTTDSKSTEQQTIQLALKQWKTPLSQWNAHSTLSLHQIANGLKPIASSFSIALNALRRTLPGRYNARPAKSQTQRLRHRLRSFT
jgi:hypothetical protein